MYCRAVAEYLELSRADTRFQSFEAWRRIAAQHDSAHLYPTSLAPHLSLIVTTSRHML